MKKVLAIVVVVVLAAVGVAQLGGSDEAHAATTIPASPVEFALVPVAEDFATPLWGTFAPGLDDQLFVVDQVGTITALRVAGVTAPERLVVLDIGSSGLNLLDPINFRQGFNERGLLGLAFHPDFASNGLLYTYGIEPRGTPDFPQTVGDYDSVVREWRMADPSDPASLVDTTSNREVIRIGQPQGNHNAGAIVFGPDDMLYIALGDGGNRDDDGPGHPAVGNGQDTSELNPLGKILRIDPLGRSGRNGQYAVPADNPFVGSAGVDEAWALGFRNPFRIAFSDAGVLYAADVGQGDREEINEVVRGGNYGWPVKEGTNLFDRNGDGPGSIGADSPGVPANMIDPVAFYDHSEGVSVTGGFVATGPSVPGLVGSYVFGDLTQTFPDPAGRLFELTSDGDLRELLAENRAEHPLFVTGFGQDARGDVYVLGITQAVTAGDTGRVLKLSPASTAATCQGVPVTIDMNSNGGDGTGTAGNDVILGTPGDDVIVANGGDDLVCAGDGDDRVFGGPGDDLLDGDGGDDTLHGNRGNDGLNGGDGADRIFGYADDDVIDGGDGNDRLHGNFGDDTITGGDGADAAFGYGDDDVVRGGIGDDLLGGNFGDDELFGESGNDVLYGSDGADVVSGGAGNDDVSGNSGNDVVDGNSGDDTLDGGIGTDQCNGQAGTDTASRCETITGVP